jgi:hypothetical protein
MVIRAKTLIEVQTLRTSDPVGEKSNLVLELIGQSNGSSSRPACALICMGRREAAAEEKKAISTSN